MSGVRKWNMSQPELLIGFGVQGGRGWGGVLQPVHMCLKL